MERSLSRCITRMTKTHSTAYVALELVEAARRVLVGKYGVDEGETLLRIFVSDDGEEEEDNGKETADEL